ncbi:hypothetical protein PVT71_11070 [Salipiger sp. H15]|uniref:Uncharacterized protein n=1 Tax=Alloyangia sp. H15 TaxID=3029062 RepID=A0AAU8AEU7_9RHOB
MKVIWALVRAIFVALFALSVLLNMAVLGGGALASLGGALLDHLPGLTNPAAALERERQASRALDDKLRGLAAEIEVERGRTGTLETRLQKTGKELVDAQNRGRLLEQSTVALRAERAAAAKAVGEASARISRRAVATASRETAAMFGEAIPYFGAAVIVGSTALELNDLCETLKDMDAIRRAVALDVAESAATATVCAVEVPTREALWTQVKVAPGEAWGMAGAVLDGIPEIELPSIDWVLHLLPDSWPWSEAPSDALADTHAEAPEQATED